MLPGVDFALATFDLYAGDALAIPGGLQLCNQTSLFELSEYAGNLPHGDFEGIVLGEIIPRP